MSTKNEIIKPKPMKIYELDDFEKLIKGIKVASCMLTEPHQTVDEESVIKRLKALTLNGASDGNYCSCCGVGPFKSRAEQTAHYKHHWHTHNLKRKLFGKPPVTFGYFNSRRDDDSSVSGSNSETESTNNPESELFAAATRHCKAFFTNQAGQVFCIYRCILHHRKEELGNDGDGRAWVERCRQLAFPSYQRWAVVMISGGHFAGGVFSGDAAVVHKTLHSYVTRRGQGQAQSTRDQHGNAPKSAGASLRRFNQAQFLEHIQEILASWTDELRDCSLVLYRAVGSLNQAALFGKGSPLSRDDFRMRALPFPTRKPTYKEVRRAHETLTSVEVYETMELFQKAMIASATTKATKSSSDASIDRNKMAQKTPPKKLIDRAKSRERTPRELPSQLMSSEDEGPCYIDSETPIGWIKALSEEHKGVISSSRKDLLNELNDCPIASSGSDSETNEAPKKENVKRKKKKRPEENQNVHNVKKGPQQKIPPNIKKMWKVITGTDESLEPLLESWEDQSGLVAACNVQDPMDGNTALHKAALASKPHMVTQILCAGGDPCTRNHAQQTPYAAAPHQDTRVAFRLFQAQFPDKYNYAKSHIPGPLTPDLVEQEKEKKAQQKRAKRQREKEKQLDKIKTFKFLQLSDVEKAEAAEPRCFLCGGVLPKTPFEYDTFKFCAVRCLQNHRSLRPLTMSA